mmetsp:Transcript_22966/g.48120  ORF Transcript_22966/g.48120 Transcript_22966/m.48120 type:complete len:165 (+) Transcript_22966:98-592(+)
MNHSKFPFSSTSSSSSMINLSTSRVLSTSTPPRRVHFSDKSEMIILDPVQREEEHLVLYTKEEMASFRRQLVYDVRTVLRALNSGVSDVILGNCVGIETFLSPELARRVIQVRNSHVKAVMDEQRHQRGLGFRSSERLKAVAEAGSRWSRDRAHELAVGYFELL